LRAQRPSSLCCGDLIALGALEQFRHRADRHRLAGRCADRAGAHRWGCAALEDALQPVDELRGIPSFALVNAGIPRSVEEVSAKALPSDGRRRRRPRGRQARRITALMCRRAARCGPAGRGCELAACDRHGHRRRDRVHRVDIVSRLAYTQRERVDQAEIGAGPFRGTSSAARHRRRAGDRTRAPPISLGSPSTTGR
jgi:hypothetical protein